MDEMATHDAEQRNLKNGNKNWMETLERINEHTTWPPL